MQKFDNFTRSKASFVNSLVIDDRDLSLGIIGVAGYRRGLMPSSFEGDELLGYNIIGFVTDDARRVEFRFLFVLPLVDDYFLRSLAVIYKMLKRIQLPENCTSAHEPTKPN